ncbi:MAG: hypothetical protein BGO69_01315 [Bacteroidetes bacterium 46-16]|nr:MAG: hypothetical protein BGO69_01315 [Bacteroidetes bacterium 46-16]
MAPIIVAKTIFFISFGFIPVINFFKNCALTGIYANAVPNFSGTVKKKENTAGKIIQKKTLSVSFSFVCINV